MKELCDSFQKLTICWSKEVIRKQEFYSAVLTETTAPSRKIARYLGWKYFYIYGVSYSGKQEFAFERDETVE